jgi:hypothetical protein
MGWPSYTPAYSLEDRPSQFSLADTHAVKPSSPKAGRCAGALSRFDKEWDHEICMAHLMAANMRAAKRPDIVLKAPLSDDAVQSLHHFVPYGATPAVPGAMCAPAIGEPCRGVSCSCCNRPRCIHAMQLPETCMGMFTAKSGSDLAVIPAAVLTWQPFFLQGPLCIMGKSEHSHSGESETGKASHKEADCWCGAGGVQDALIQGGRLEVWIILCRPCHSCCYHAWHRLLVQAFQPHACEQQGQLCMQLSHLKQLLLSHLSPPSCPGLKPHACGWNGAAMPDYHSQSRHLDQKLAKNLLRTS